MVNPSNQNLNVFHDLCPCNSGKKIIDCCYAEINTTPPGNKTGYSHPNCYARDLKDCSSTISREHYISESVLALFGHGSFEVSGFSWLKNGETKRLPKGVLTSKVLCQRHNQALSGLDLIASKFFRLVLGKTSDQWAMVVRGYEIERWLLKVYCGLITTGAMMHKDKRLPKLRLGQDFLETLFCRKEIPTGNGLIFNLEKSLPSQPGLIRLSPMVHENCGIVGFSFQIEFLRLMLAFGTVSDFDNETERSKGLRYHPRSIAIRDGDKYREVHFGWPDGRDIVIDGQVAYESPS